MGWWRGARGWWLVAAAAALAAVAPALSGALPAVIATALVAVLGALTAVVTAWGTRALEKDEARSDRPAADLFTGGGRRPQRVRDVNGLVVGVHPAAATGPVAGLPLFVRRDRSEELERAVRGSGLVLVTGESTAGKTRAVFEAARSCLPRHALLRPVSRESLQHVPTAVRGARGCRDCVVWLDDLERYLGPGGLTTHLVAKISAAARGHVVILATMRSQERARWRARSVRGEGLAADDAREALAVFGLATEIHLDRRWSPRELERARPYTDDHRMADALRHADRFGVAEYLAAGPQLLAEWRDGWAPACHPRGAALVAVAVDARRAGWQQPVTVDLLRPLHGVYLRRAGGELLRPEPWDQALAWASSPLHATTSLLIPDETGGYLAFDYLLDAVDGDPEAEPVPDPLWQALLGRATPPEADGIGWAAMVRGDSPHARASFQKAYDGGVRAAAVGLAESFAIECRYQEAMRVLRRALRVVQADGSDQDPAVLLQMKAELAWVTGMAGDEAEALRIIRSVEQDAERILGPDHPMSLTSRVLRARHTGENGDPQQALQLARSAAESHERVLGKEHGMSLSSRFEVALWTGECGDPAAAVRLLRVLERDCTRLFGEHAKITVDTRLNLAHWLGKSGEPTAGLALVASRVAYCERLYGADHPKTIRAHYFLVDLTGASGRPDEAMRRAQAVEASSERVLGRDNSRTFDARLDAARWTAEAGHTAEAAARLRALAADVTRVLGPDHSLVFECRHKLAALTAKTGPVAQAAQQYDDLLADLKRAPATGRTRIDQVAEERDRLRCDPAGGDGQQP